MNPEDKARNVFPFVSLVVLGIAFSMIWFYVFVPSDKNLKVVFCDVGQGDGALIKFPDGKIALVDAGPNRKILECLGKNIPFYRKKIDIVFLSHPDADHVGGLSYVLASYQVGRVVESGIGRDTQAYKSFVDIVKGQKITDTKAIGGAAFDIASGAKIQILLPRSTVAGPNLNNMSEILLLGFGKENFLFTGDMEKEEAGQVASLYPDVRADVIKIPHHGSKYSLDEKFYRQLQPKYAVISVGAKNRYGHPHAEVLNFLGKSGIRIFRTDKSGDISFETDGQMLREEN